MPFLENIATDVFKKPTVAHPANYWPMGLYQSSSFNILLNDKLFHFLRKKCGTFLRVPK